MRHGNMKYDEDTVVVGPLVQNQENVNELPETTALEQGFSFARVYPSRPNFALNGMSTAPSLQKQLFAVATTAGCFVPFRGSLCGGLTLKTRAFG